MKRSWVQQCGWMLELKEYRLVYLALAFSPVSCVHRLFALYSWSNVKICMNVVPFAFGSIHWKSQYFAMSGEPLIRYDRYVYV